MPEPSGSGIFLRTFLFCGTVLHVKSSTKQNAIKTKDDGKPADNYSISKQQSVNMKTIKSKLSYFAMATAIVAMFMCVQAVMITCDVLDTIKSIGKK